MSTDPESFEPAGTDRSQQPSAGTALLRERVLDAVRDEATRSLGAHLLETTGPLSELRSAERRGILDDVRRRLIARKGSGVVFEAATLVQLQDASERFRLDIAAALSITTNDARADIRIRFRGQEIELQLKTGADRYLRASIRARADGTFVLIPSDAGHISGVGVATSLNFDDVQLAAPAREELVEQAQSALETLSHGDSPGTLASIGKELFCGSVADGLAAVVLDLLAQQMESPGLVDWRRSGKVLLRATATSAASSLVAYAAGSATIGTVSRSVDLASAFRATQVAACIVPHAIDLAIDVAGSVTGEVSTDELVRSFSAHAGATSVELLLFPYLARLASKLGPVGRVIALLAGGFLLTKLGETVGEFIANKLVAGSEKQLSVGQPVAPTVTAAIVGPESTTEPIAAGAVLDPVGNRVVEPMPEGPQTGGKNVAWGEIAISVLQIVNAIAMTLVAQAAAEAERRQALAEGRMCEEIGCGRRHRARGMCSMHYLRWWRGKRPVSATGAVTGDRCSPNNQPGDAP